MICEAGAIITSGDLRGSRRQNGRRDGHGRHGRVALLRCGQDEIARSVSRQRLLVVKMMVVVASAVVRLEATRSVLLVIVAIVILVVVLQEHN